MRLFVAVDLAERVRKAVAAYAADLASRLTAARLVRFGTATWVAERNLHLTLRFIGEVDEAAGARLAGAVGSPFELEAFDLYFDRPGVFPSAGSPRVLWIGVGQGVRELGALADRVESRLRAAGIPAERRPFSAHLTLARFKQPPAQGIGGELAASALPRPLGPSPVDHVTLYESRLAAGGPSYRVVVRAPLDAGGRGRQAERP